METIEPSTVCGYVDSLDRKIHNPHNILSRLHYELNYEIRYIICYNIVLVPKLDMLITVLVSLCFKQGNNTMFHYASMICNYSC